MTVATRLRAARHAAGLTQAEVAGRLGVRVQYYSALERGAKVPTLDWLWHAATALGYDPHDLDDRLHSTTDPTHLIQEP